MGLCGEISELKTEPDYIQSEESKLFKKKKIKRHHSTLKDGDLIQEQLLLKFDSIQFCKIVILSSSYEAILFEHSVNVRTVSGQESPARRAASEWKCCVALRWVYTLVIFPQ